MVSPFPQLLELDRGQIAERAVKTFMIVFTSPALDENLGLDQ